MRIEQRADVALGVHIIHAAHVAAESRAQPFDPHPGNRWRSHHATAALATTSPIRVGDPPSGGRTRFDSPALSRELMTSSLESRSFFKTWTIALSNFFGGAFR